MDLAAYKMFPNHGTVPKLKFKAIKKLTLAYNIQMKGHSLQTLWKLILETPPNFMHNLSSLGSTCAHTAISGTTHTNRNKI